LQNLFTPHDESTAVIKIARKYSQSFSRHRGLGGCYLEGRMNKELGVALNITL